MKLQKRDRIGEGAWADVFRNGDRVYKVFKSSNHPEVANMMRAPEEHQFAVRKRFKREEAAYRKVADSDAKTFAPRFFGVEIDFEVWDGGQNITSEYEAGCCLMLEFIVGEERRIRSVEPVPGPLRMAIAAFAKLKLDARTDGSVFFPDDETRIKLIDFADGLLDVT